MPSSSCSIGPSPPLEVRIQKSAHSGLWWVQLDIMSWLNMGGSEYIKIYLPSQDRSEDRSEDRNLFGKCVRCDDGDVDDGACVGDSVLVVASDALGTVEDDAGGFIMDGKLECSAKSCSRSDGESTDGRSYICCAVWDW